jgi:hypothetical protein
MDVSFALPTNDLHNHYSGGLFVAHGTAVTAPQIFTTLNDVPFIDRAPLGVAPIASAVTALTVTVLLGMGAPRDLSSSITCAGGFTFEFAPLVAACGLLVVALARLSEMVGITAVNLSVLKNDRAREPVLGGRGGLCRPEPRRRRGARPSPMNVSSRASARRATA